MLPIRMTKDSQKFLKNIPPKHFKQIVNKIFELSENLEGIDLCCGSGHNIIYLNSFEKNNKNANDDLFNQWDNGIVGNYWDDYNGEDNNDDGIGDVPYNITHPENFDHYPLMNIPKSKY